MRKAFTFGLALAAAMAGAGATFAFAQTLPDNENGRYAMSQIGSTVVRLDTRTGVVSTCSDNGNGWACYAAPDERAAFDSEIGRLRDENEKLRTQLAQRDTVTGKTDEALPKTDVLPKEDPLAPVPKSAERAKPDEDRKLEIPLPSDRDMDRVMSFLQNAWRRLVDLATQMQKDANRI